MDQRELEGKARWFSGIGCVFSDDFAQKHVGSARMKLLDMSGAYAWRFDLKPQPCTFVTFGAGGTWTLDLPITKQATISRTEAEMSRMSGFVMGLDPEGKFGLRTWAFHLDLKPPSAGGCCRMARRPSDDEIAKLPRRRSRARRRTKRG